MADLGGIGVTVSLVDDSFQAGARRIIDQTRRLERQSHQSFNRAGASVQRYSGQFRGAIGNVAQQIQDVVVQFQAGTNAAIIFAQQGPQIAGAFGPAGAVIGAFGAIAVVAASSIFGFNRTADKTPDILEKVTGGFDDAKDAAARYIKVLAEATDEQRRFAQQVAATEGRQTLKQALSTAAEIAPLVLPFTPETLAPVLPEDVPRARAAREALLASRAELTSKLQAAVRSGDLDALQRIINESGISNTPAGIQVAQRLLEQAAAVVGDRVVETGEAALLGRLRGIEPPQSRSDPRKFGLGGGGRLTEDQLRTLEAIAQEEERLARQAEAEAKRREREGETEARRIARRAQAQQERIANFRLEVEQSQRLADAARVNLDLYEETKIAVEAENRVKRLGVDISDERFAGLLKEAEALERNEAAAREAIKADQERQREIERQQDQATRTAERQAEETQRLLNRPFENFLSNIQSSTTSAFETIYSGGVQTFADLFDTASQLAVRFAAEMSSLFLFRPGFAGGAFGGGSGAAGTFATAAAAAAAFPTASPAALASLSGGAPGLGSTLGVAGLFGGNNLGQLLYGANPALFGAGAPLSFLTQSLSAGGLISGALGFGLGGFGANALGLNQTGGAVGGGLGALLGFGAAGPLGGFLGGTLGTLGGGFLGNLFGGGKQDDNAQFQLNLASGRVSPVVGTNADPGNVQAVQALGSQIQLFREGLLDLGAELAEFDLEVKAGLESGFRLRTPGGPAGEEKFGSAEELLAGALRKIIETSEGGLSPAQRRIAGISEATTAQDLIADLGIPEALERLRRPASVFGEAMKALGRTFRDVERDADRLEQSTKGLAEARAREEETLRIGALAELGIGSQFNVAIDNIRRQFGTAFREREQLGLTGDEVQTARIQQASIVRSQALAELGIFTPLRVQIEAASQAFDQARRSTTALGVTVKQLDQAERRQLETAQRQTEQQIVGLQAGFRSRVEGSFNFLDPLRAVESQIRLGQGTPITQLAEAQKRFAATRELALGGDIEALQQFPEIARQLTDLARQTFATGPQAIGIEREVLTSLQTLVERGERERDQLLRGIDGGITTIADLTRVLEGEKRDLIVEVKGLRGDVALLTKKIGDLRLRAL